MNPENKLRQLEKKLKHQLPESYKYFLARQISSKPKAAMYVIPSHLHTPVKIIKVAYFFHINPEQDFFLLDIIEKYKDFVKKCLLPIAYDKFLNLIFLNLIDRKIYIRDVKEKKLYLIAENFEDFFDKLY